MTDVKETIPPPPGFEGVAVQFDPETHRLTESSRRELLEASERALRERGASPESVAKARAKLEELLGAPSIAALGGNMLLGILEHQGRAAMGIVDQFAAVAKILAQEGRARACYQAGIAAGFLLNAAGSLMQSHETLAHALGCECNEPEKDAEKPSAEASRGAS